MIARITRHINEKKSNFLIKNISRKKCNVIAHKQLNSINTTFIFQTSINVNDNRFIAMIDSNATKNFMSKSLIKKKRLFIRQKKKHMT